MGGGVKVTRKVSPLRPIGGVGVPLPKRGDGAGHSCECLNDDERIFDHRTYLNLLLGFALIQQSTANQMWRLPAVKWFFGAELMLTLVRTSRGRLACTLIA